MRCIPQQPRSQTSLASSALGINLDDVFSMEAERSLEPDHEMQHSESMSRASSEERVALTNPSSTPTIGNFVDEARHSDIQTGVRSTSLTLGWNPYESEPYAEGYITSDLITHSGESRNVSAYVERRGDQRTTALSPPSQRSNFQGYQNLAGGKGNHDGSSGTEDGNAVEHQSETATISTTSFEEMYSNQIMTLNSYGFYDVERNIRCLRATQGDGDKALDELLSGHY